MVFIIGWLANKALGLRVDEEAEEAEGDGISDAEHAGQLCVPHFGWWSWRRLSPSNRLPTRKVDQR